MAWPISRGIASSIQIITELSTTWLTTPTRSLTPWTVGRPSSITTVKSAKRATWIQVPAVPTGRHTISSIARLITRWLTCTAVATGP